MTNEEKLAKVRAEIERRYNYHKDHADDYAGTDHFWKADEDRELLSFIDSIQKEPKECMYTKDNYTDEDRKVLCEDCKEECEFNKKEESINKGLDLGCGVIWKDEEPVSEELEKACEQLAENARKHKAETSSPFFSQGDYKQGVIDGAKWQKAKYESTTEDLGDYINELSKQFPEVSFAKLSRIAVRVAKWKEEQLMAKAVDAVVKIDAGGYPYVDRTIELYDYDKDIPLAKKGISIK